MPKTKKRVILARVPVELAAEAKKQAKKEDRPLSQVIRDLLRIWIKEKEQSTK